MRSISFSWDDRKNKANQKKHRVSFEEAQSVFFDDQAIEYYDPDHSESEERFLMLGVSNRVRVLVVSYTLMECKQNVEGLFIKTNQTLFMFIRPDLYSPS